MEQELPLSALAKVVAASRGRGLVARLVVRNGERFGLLHLYFEQGRLVHVEGHLGDPMRSLGDLSTWRQGSVRQDTAAIAGQTLILDPRLDAALDSSLRALVERHVADAPASGNLPPISRVPPTSWPPHASQPERVGTGGLPPLSRTSAPRADAASTATALAQRNRLTTPQWQLVALVVRQMVEKVDRLAGAEMAESLLRQSLAHVARSNPILRDLEVERSGWLKETLDAAMTTQSAEDVAEAIAALLTNFELRCGSLIGKDRAHEVLASTAEPYRAALAQIGLDIAD